VRIRASFLRAGLWFGGLVVLLQVCGSIFSYIRFGTWPTANDCFHTLIGVIVASLAGCVVVIPRSVSLTEETIEITRPFRRTVVASTDELEYWTENSWFMFQFENHPLQMISSFGFARSDWRRFIGEFRRRFPERESIGGPFMIPRFRK
jgi:hypothetical protein